MSEQQAFIAMLTRAGIGHGLRHDYYPRGTSVLVEHGEGEDDPFWITAWSFDKSGVLKEVSHYEGVKG